MKRVLATALALVLALGLFAGIGTAESAEPTTIKVLGFERKIADGVSFAERETQKTWQEINKIFADNGLAFEFEIIADQDQYRTTIQTRLASNYDLPDVCYVGTMTETDVLDMAQTGIILPMNQVLETTKGAAYDFFYGGEGDVARKMLTDANGNFYWLPRIQINLLNGEQSGTSMGVCIRLDWLKKLGLPVPKSLDEFTGALRAFQENDMNGNGIKDEVAVLDTSLFSASGIGYWFGMVSDYVAVNVTDGVVESPWYSPVAKEYFAYVQSLVSEGLLYADKIGSDTNTDQVQNENKVSALYYYPVGTYVEIPIRAAGYPDAYYIGIEPFDAVEGTQAYYSEETPYLQYMKYAVTSAGADKLDAIAKMYDCIYSPEMLNLIDWGIEGVNYEVRDGMNHRLGIDVGFAEKFANGTLEFDPYARFFFPSFRHNERLDEIEGTRKEWPEKADFEMATADYPKKTPNDNLSYYALATAEEAETLAEYTTDLSTYSRELAANLSLGRQSLDDWDSYIEELKNLGLDEVIAVRQAQLDRRNGK
ncbi:MAG: extracellular solute-binding protein [Clostridiales bacterium]|nr:extracellular solute-binding protein [Clostridiales bacterium]